MASNQDTVAAIVSELRAQGASDNAIRGVLANVKDESGFNSSLRHADQPKWGGEAHFAHGLYQEGGAEWNNYADWLSKNYPDASWTDPTLQTRFLAQNMKANYAPVWNAMNNGSGEQAAQGFVHGYLKPAKEYQDQRSDAYANGVPGLAAYGNVQPQPLSPDAVAAMGGQAGSQAVGSALDPTGPQAAIAAATAAVPQPAPSVAPSSLPGSGAPSLSMSGLLQSAGVNPSNIGGTGIGLTGSGLSIPGLGTLSGSVGQQQTTQEPYPVPNPLSMSPLKKPLDMRGIQALAQAPRLGILNGVA